jgi:hypothetical protein
MLEIDLPYTLIPIMNIALIAAIAAAIIVVAVLLIRKAR